MDFHHDEISALLRTRFDSFSELIAQGVRVDGHPGFVQWFLWVWTGAFGYHPGVVKLPFILGGIASVGLLYGVGKALFSARVGWLAASFMAVLQYGVIFSQWARPYAFGMLFVLSATWFLLNYIRTNKLRDLLFFAATAALCGYTHYMALLQIVVVSVMITVFQAEKHQRKWLVIGGLLAALIWLPHLNITLYHLSLGGVGDWLQPPSADFWKRLIAMSFNHSWIIGGLVLFVIFSSIGKFRWSREDWMKRTMLAGMWLIPFLLVFVYSHRVSALMHHASMFFLFPFLLLLVASFGQAFHGESVRFIAVFVLLIGTYELFSARQHVATNLRTEYQDPLRYVAEVEKELHPDLQGKKIRLLMDLRLDAVEFLQEQGIADYSKVDWIEPIWNEGLWSHYLDTSSADGILIVTTPASKPEYLAAAQWYFPAFITGRAYHTASAHLLWRGEGSSAMHLGVNSASESLGGEDYGHSLTVDLSDRDGYHYLCVNAAFSAGLVGNAQLVYEWTSNDGRKERRSAYLKNFRQAAPSQYVLLGGDIRDLPGYEVGGTLNTYIWNPQRDSFAVEYLQVNTYRGVEGRYGLFSDNPKVN
ncbi:MAG: glycosyltransferase family 39 protein [Flavobacteriales bacterium]|nr:glycosyltransferase family 39 protein [Flavobacteriales bacterium]